MLTFGEATAALEAASGRPLQYAPVSFEQYAEGLAELFGPPVVAFFIDLFRFLLDGHNARLSDDVQRLLGRPARDFASYAQRAADGLR